MDDNCGEWVESMGVASVCVVVRRYIDFLILLIPTPLVSVLFCSSIPTFCSFLKMFSVLTNTTYSEMSGDVFKWLWAGSED